MAATSDSNFSRKVPTAGPFRLARHAAPTSVQRSPLPASPHTDTLDLAAIRTRHTLLLLRLLWAGDRARVDIARELGLSRSAVGNIVAELLGTGLVQEVGQREGGKVGRRATLLRLNARAAALVAIDLGASHARVDVLDLRCRSLATRRVPHDITAGPPATYALLARLTRQALAAAQVETAQVALVGLGTPGPMDHASGQLMQPPNMPGWDGENVRAGLQRRLGLPVLVDNDANLGALAEARFGAHREASDLIYIKAATGIGAGIVLGGRLYRGARGGAGEIGHIRLELGEQAGTLESYAAAGALPAVAERLRADFPDSALPSPATVEDLLAHASDPLARAVWAEAGHRLGVGVSTLLNLFNPQVVVIGGRLAQAGEALLEAVRVSACRYTMTINAGGVRVELGTLGADAGILGAGAMGLGHLFTPHGLPRLQAIARGPTPLVGIGEGAASRAPPAGTRAAPPDPFPPLYPLTFTQTHPRPSHFPLEES